MPFCQAAGLSYIGSTGVPGGPVACAASLSFSLPPAGSPDADRVVWGQVTGSTGFHVMAYDVPTAAGPAPAATEPGTPAANSVSP